MEYVKIDIETYDKLVEAYRDYKKMCVNQIYMCEHGTFDVYVVDDDNLDDVIQSVIKHKEKQIKDYREENLRLNENVYELNKRLIKYEHMTFWQRVKFIFK